MRKRNDFAFSHLLDFGLKDTLKRKLGEANQQWLVYRLLVTVPSVFLTEKGLGNYESIRDTAAERGGNQ